MVLLVSVCAGKALLAEVADNRPLLRVHLHVVLQVCHQAEGLATLGAAMTPHLRVNLQSERIRKCLETQGTMVEVFGVCLFMVEEGAGVTVGAPTQVTREALVSSVRLLGSGSYRAPLTSAATVSLQTGPALETLPARGTAEVTCHAVVDPLVVVQDAGEAEGLAARETHVLLLLRVDARVIAQGHGVGEGLRAVSAAEGSGLVGIFVVQE